MSPFSKLCFIGLYLTLISLNVPTEAKNKISSGKRLTNREFTKGIVSLRFGDYLHHFAHRCGGSILSMRMILTAGHCVVDSDFHKPTFLWAIAGSITSKIFTEEAQVHPIERVILHPEYITLDSEADLAIVRTLTRIYEDGINVNRIQLYGEQPKDGLPCIALGWGSEFETRQHTEFPGVLMYVDQVIIREGELCPFGTSGLFCAGDLSDANKSVQEGDSGGPLLCNGTVCGVVSHALGPQPFKYYIDVYFYRKWIMDHVNLSGRFEFI